jgi:hypothetical protein
LQVRLCNWVLLPQQLTEISSELSGDVASLTSTNNFINFCLTVPNLPITNGKQITTGSCNPAPLGLIPANALIPTTKFSSPTNGAEVAANSPFTISLAANNLATGSTTNPTENFAAAPQQVDEFGRIIGHVHVVIEEILESQTTPTNPQAVAFFSEMDTSKDNDGILTVNVESGLPFGLYRMSSIVVASNHQPVVVGTDQHGSLDDIIFVSGWYLLL